ncbi:MAG: hypothetical protein LBK98_03690, partial [Peptococcaceae bacterium]|nr:hypothetical protein [Peptococcaceae bacterium]
MRRFCCAVLCILLLLPGGGAPLGALVDGAGGGAFTDAPTANGTDAAGAGKVLSEQATDLPTKVLTLPELYEKVKVA